MPPYLHSRHFQLKPHIPRDKIPQLLPTPPLPMAAVLSFRQPPSLQPSSPSRNLVRRIPLRVSAQFPESPSSSSSVSTKVVVEEEGEGKLGFSSSSTIIAPPNFKPPEPKRFAIRPDKTFDILSASLALIFRLGTGVFVQGYEISLSVLLTQSICFYICMYF